MSMKNTEQKNNTVHWLRSEYGKIIHEIACELGDSWENHINQGCLMALSSILQPCYKAVMEIGGFYDIIIIIDFVIFRADI